MINLGTFIVIVIAGIFWVVSAWLLSSKDKEEMKRKGMLKL